MGNFLTGSVVHRGICGQFQRVQSSTHESAFVIMSVQFNFDTSNVKIAFLLSRNIRLICEYGTFEYIGTYSGEVGR